MNIGEELASATRVRSDFIEFNYSKLTINRFDAEFNIIVHFYNDVHVGLINSYVINKNSHYTSYPVTIDVPSPTRFIKVDIGRIDGADGADLLISDITGAEFKLESGGIATRYSQSPKDIDYRIQSLDFIKSAIENGSTEPHGGLLLTNLLFMKNLASQVTGGFSGLDGDNVGIWTGGTYAQALADVPKAFKSAMSTAALDKKDGSGHRAKGNFAWDTVGNVFLKGVMEALSGGKIGNFSIVNGKIVGYDAGIERIILSSDAIPTSIASLAGATVFLPVPMDLTYEGTVDYLGNSGLVLETGGNFVLAFATTIQTYESQYGYQLQDQSVVLSNVEEKYLFYNSQNVFIGSCLAGETLSFSAAGTYRCVHRASVYFTFADEQSYSPVQFDMTGGRSPSYAGSNAKTEIGNNGFYSYWSSSQYIYFCPTVGFEVRFGLFIFQLSSSLGLRKSSDGGTNWAPL